MPKPLTAAPSPASPMTHAAVTSAPVLSDSRDRTIRRPSVSAADAGVGGETVGLAAAAATELDPAALAAALPSNGNCPALLPPTLRATSSGTSAGSVLALQSGICTANSLPR